MSPTDPRPTTFALHRASGHVADGARWADGSVSVRWLGESPSIVFWPDFASFVRVNGHQGTEVVWDLPPMIPPDLQAVQGRLEDCLQGEIEGWDPGPMEAALWASLRDVQPLMAEVARLRAVPAERTGAPPAGRDDVTPGYETGPS